MIDLDKSSDVKYILLINFVLGIKCNELCMDVLTIGTIAWRIA